MDTDDRGVNAALIADNGPSVEELEGSVAGRCLISRNITSYVL